MAHVEDRWEQMLEGRKVRTERHGTGKRWRARWRDPQGKHRSRGFERKVDAERFLATVEGDKLRGAYVDPRDGRQTVASYSEVWLASLSRRESTIYLYRSHMRAHILPAVGHRPLAAVTPTEIRGLVKGLASKLAPTTVVTIHTVLASLFRAAVADRLIVTCPTDRTRPPRPARREVMPLTPEQVSHLIDFTPARWQGVVVAGAGLGLRLSEVLGLRRDRVDFLRRQVEVREQLVLNAGEPPKLGPLKTRASERIVPLPTIVADALAAHLAEFGSDASPLVFTSTVGTPVRRTSFAEHVWSPAIARAGLPAGTRFHDLRHTYASLLIAAGEHPKVIQARLGHASITETMDTYGHLWPDAEEATRAAVDRAFLALASHPRPREVSC